MLRFVAALCLLSSPLLLAGTPSTPCEGALAKPLQVQSSGWSHDLPQTRLRDANQAGLTADDLPNLALQWAFAYEDTEQPRSLPAVTVQAIIAGSEEGTVWALDRRSGCAYWSYRAGDEPIRTAITLAQFENKTVALFGDADAQLHAIDAQTGKGLWVLKLDPHRSAIMTGSPVYHDGFVYAPASSLEVAQAVKPWYNCCTFRGSVSKVDVRTGERVWQYFTIPDAPAFTGRSLFGVRQYGPSGAPVWSAPTIDVKRNRLYVGTGQNYSSPADHNSDAIHAIDMTTGERIWRTQFLAEDSWNAACNVGLLQPNCPEEDGPDYDFGAPPILISRDDGNDILVAGQKSGMVFGINPDNGQQLWMNSAGRGGIIGGVHWGMASDGAFVYVPVSDIDVWPIDVPGEPRPALNKIDVTTGETVWSVPAVFDCKDKTGCRSGLSAAITLIPGAVIAPGMDGVLRAYSRDDGRVLWQFDTVRDYDGINGVKGEGGTLDAGGAVVADGQLIIHSGYGGLISAGSKGGNVLLVFGKKASE